MGYACSGPIYILKLNIDGEMCTKIWVPFSSVLWRLLVLLGTVLSGTILHGLIYLLLYYNINFNFLDYDVLIVPPSMP